MSEDMTLTPEYRFEWSDGSSRDTSRLTELVEDSNDLKPEAIETLAEIGRSDENCEVTLLGFGN